jgi:(Z)-2-((N-methylformamido)methylene)-5-hydroxybutyrolactone dehydrogenase
MGLDLATLESTGLLVGGNWRPGSNGRFTDTAPRDGAVFATAPDGNAGDMRAAVTAASDMAVAQQELFGPVLAVIPYRDEAEAVAIANDTRFGLIAAVFGADEDRAERIASQLRAGQVTVNGAMALGPFGGFGESGIGREHGLAGLREYTETRTVSRPRRAGA